MTAPDLIVGDTGSGKTKLLASAIEYVWRKYKKRSRVYSSDGGGAGEQDDDLSVLVKLGIVEVLWMREARPGWFPLEVVKKVSKGWWPDAKGALAPPTSQALQEVGLWGFEGMTSMADWLLETFAAFRAKGINVGDLQSNVKPFPMSGELADVNSTTALKDAGNSASDYGLVQRTINRMVVDCRVLPGKKIWSALEICGKEDKESDWKDRPTGLQRKLVFGPALGGSARTALIGKDFGNTLSLELVRTKEGGLRRRLHLEPWFDDENPKIPHLAKVRGVAEGAIPPYLEGTGAEPSMSTFYDMLEREFEKVRTRKAKELEVEGVK